MKKITLIMSLAALFIGLQAKAADVYVETSDPTFNVYTWGPELYGGWPGAALTSDAVGATLTTVNGKQYYKFTIDTQPGTTRFIIFNKDSKQTPNIPLQEGDNFFVYPKGGDYGQYETSNPPIAITSYTVAGDELLMGSNWSTTDTNNDMELQADGTYKLVKNNVELTARSYEYKVVGNHQWGLWEVPSQGNHTLNIAAAGKYNVTFTLDTEVPELSATAELVEETVVTITSFTIVGDSTLVGSNWNPEDAVNDMALQADGTFQLEKKDIDLQAGTYEYKATANHAWGVWELPMQGNNELTIDKAGKYDVTFTLDTAALTLTAVPLLKEEPVVTITSFTIVGDSTLVGSKWNPEDTANDMALQADGTFQLEKKDIDLLAGTYEYKATANHAWSVWELPMQGNNELTIDKAGKYDVTFTLDTAALTLTAVPVLKEEPVVNYVLHYGLNEDGAVWNDVNFVAGQETYEGKLVAANVEFAENTEFGVLYGETWYAGQPNAGEDYYLVHSAWCTDIPLATDGVKNFRINEAGTYTFILTVGDEGITMDVKGWSLSGDVNADGKVDVADVNIVINIMLGKDNAENYDGRADFNKDGKVDVTDVNKVINAMLNQ